MWWSLMRSQMAVTPRASTRILLGKALVGAWMCVGCGSAQPPPPAPASVPTPTPTPSVASASKPEGPPPSGVAPDWKFPTIKDVTLDNGLLLRVVPRHALPIVRLDLVVKSGSATDREKPGVAAVAGELLKAGGAGKWTSRALLDAAESLGSSLDIVTDRDATHITMSVTKDHVGEALDVIAAVAMKPKFDSLEFSKLQHREVDRVSSLIRTSAGWVASMVLYREAFALPTGAHPYAHYDANPKEVQALTLKDCKAWHGREFSPKNAVLIVAGDVEQDGFAAEARRAFGTWKGQTPELPTFAPPFPPAALSIYLVDRPASPQAEVYVATLGPDRKSPDWPALRATNQILGGGVAGRLFLDVREKRSLAYRTRSSVEPFAHGPSLLVLSAGTQTAKAGLALGALLEHFDALSKAPPSDDEVEIATRYLSDVFLVGVDTVGAIASLTSELSVFGLPNDYYDTYRGLVRGVQKNTVFDLSTRTFVKGKAVVVVAGDATRLGKPLSHFGEVRIVDAEHGFITKTTVGYDPTATVELPRVEGT